MKSILRCFGVTSGSKKERPGRQPMQPYSEEKEPHLRSQKQSPSLTPASPNHETDSSEVQYSLVQASVILPRGWEQRVENKTGRIFYVDHNTKTTHWQPPNYEEAPPSPPSHSHAPSFSSTIQEDTEPEPYETTEAIISSVEDVRVETEAPIETVDTTAIEKQINSNNDQPNDYNSNVQVTEEPDDEQNVSIETTDSPVSAVVQEQVTEQVSEPISEIPTVEQSSVESTDETDIISRRLSTHNTTKLLPVAQKPRNTRRRLPTAPKPSLSSISENNNALELNFVPSEQVPLETASAPTTPQNHHTSDDQEPDDISGRNKISSDKPKTSSLRMSPGPFGMGGMGGGDLIAQLKKKQMERKHKDDDVVDA
jgi:hypothetical protein